DPKPLRLKMRVSDLVRFQLGVLSAVDLHHKQPLKADEVKDVGPEWRLPSELDAAKAAVAQQKPKLTFGISRDPPHGACSLALPRRDDLMVRCVRHEPLTLSSVLMFRRR